MKLGCLKLRILALTAVLGVFAASCAEEPPVRVDPAKEPSATRFEKDVVPFLTKHCFACHGGGKSKGDLTLDRYRDEQAILKDREVWENVSEMVHTGQMPPKAKGRPRPAPSEVEHATRAIHEILERSDCTGPRNDGRVTIRRLNRTEYNNTIRDLVGVDFKPAADFPNDDVGYGFDNIGDVLSVSPLLLEKYLSAAEAILEQAIVSNDPPKPAKERVSSLRASFGAGSPRRGGGIFLKDKGQISGQIYVDEGDYTIRAEVFGQQVGDEPVRGTLRVGRDVLKEFELKFDQRKTGDDRGEGPSQSRHAHRRGRLPQSLYRAPEAWRRAQEGRARTPQEERRPIPAYRPRQAPARAGRPEHLAGGPI